MLILGELRVDRIQGAESPTTRRMTMYAISRKFSDWTGYFTGTMPTWSSLPNAKKYRTEEKAKGVLAKFVEDNVPEDERVYMSEKLGVVKV
jgi:hypothetical protein